MYFLFAIFFLRLLIVVNEVFRVTNLKQEVVADRIVYKLHIMYLYRCNVYVVVQSF